MRNGRIEVQPRLVGTIVFPSRFVMTAGVALVLMGIVLFGFLIAWRPAPPPSLLQIVGSGELRPRMALLPAGADGERLAFAEREISQGEYFRVIGEVPPTVATRTGQSANCPARLGPEMPITCITPYEAALYADRLTELTNAHAPRSEPRLTQCYNFAAGVSWADKNCTGFRLPTEAEWRRATLAGRTADEIKSALPPKSCLRARTAVCPGVVGPGPVPAAAEPNGWFLFDLIGNIAEIVFVRDGGQEQWRLAGGAWDAIDPPDGSRPLTLVRNPSAGFRVVRRVIPRQPARRVGEGRISSVRQGA
jgi:formylglycine-generating enzyme required for sulfatase activity